MKAGAKRIGRPMKPAEEGKRVSLGLKVSPAIKTRIDAAAKENGRTQSQEAEARIERTFREDRLLTELLEAAYGRRLAGILLTLGSAMKTAGTVGAFRSTFTLDAVVEWPSNPYAFDQAVTAATRLLEAMRPTGPIEKASVQVTEVSLVVDPATGERRLEPSADARGDNALDSLGAGSANGVLHAIALERAPGDFAELGEQVRKLLGPEIVNRIAERLGSESSS